MMTVVPADRQQHRSPAPADGRRRLNLTGLVSAAVGLALFAWFVRRIGPREIWDDLTAVGWGFLAIVAITGARFALRTIAWRLCLEAPHRLSFLTAFTAVLAGDAVGNLTPLGFIAGEPAKAALVRDRIPLGASLTALAIENIFYTLSALGMIAASTVALLFTFTLPPLVREAGWIAVAAVAIVFVTVAWLLWKQPAIIARTLSAIVPAGWRIHAQIARVHDLENEIYTFASRRGAGIVPIVGAEAGFHALGVLEIYLTWWLMQGVPPPVLTAFILEGATRLITVVFKFVPLQLGVGEMGLAGFTQLLGYGATPGTSLSIVRKARVVFWVIVGTALFVKKSTRQRAQGS